jgi:CRP-like cAMP-binding protein
VANDLPPALRERLQGAELLSELDHLAVDALFAVAARRTVERKVRLFLAGEPARTLFLMVSGRAKLLQSGVDGQEIILRLISPGEILGGVAVMTGSAYPATAEVVEASELLYWPEEEVRRLTATYPNLAAAVLRVVSGRMRDLQARLHELATERVAQRVARALLRLAHQTGRKTPEGVLLDLALSRQDLAEMTGTTLFTVSRLLSAWEADGLLDAGRERVLIRRPHGLVRIAEDLP